MPTYSIPKNVLIQAVGNETVVLDMSKGAYFELNGMGTEMLKRLQNFENTDAVIQSLASEYRVTKSDVEIDLRTFISKLIKHGLLKESN